MFLALTLGALLFDVRGSGTANWLSPVTKSVVVGAILWAAPLYEQATRDPGNMTRLVGNNIRQGGSNHTLHEAVEVLAVPLTLSGRGLMGRELGRLGVSSPVANGPTIALGVVVIAIALYCAVRGFRRSNLYEAGLCGGAAVGSVALAVALTRAQGPLEGYLTLSGMSLGFLLYLGIALTVVREVELRRGNQSPTIRLPVVCVVASLAIALGVIVGDARNFVYATRTSPAGAEGTIAGLTRTLPPGRILVKIDEPGLWPTATLIANQLEKAGHSTSTTFDWIFMFGDQRTATGCEAASVSVRPPSPGKEAGERVVGTIDNAEIVTVVLRPPAECAD